jgi:transcriptional regulator with XRE-family HTH domain
MVAAIENRRKAVRRPRGLSVRAAAARAGISPTWWSQIVAGTGKPTSAVLAAMAVAVGGFDIVVARYRESGWTPDEWPQEWVDALERGKQPPVLGSSDDVEREIGELVTLSEHEKQVVLEVVRALRTQTREVSQ